MENAYEIHPDRKVWGKSNSIEAMHARKVPGIQCPVCGAWAMTGIIYPSIDVSSINKLPLPVKPSPVSVENFNRLASGIAQILGAGRPLMPGTELGRLHGKAKGSFGDFAWVNPWTPLLRESVWHMLNRAGIGLVGERANLNFGKQAHESLIELEVITKAKLISSLVPEKCAICGRLPMRKPDSVMVDAASFDSSVPLQRIVELPTVLVANESLAHFIQQNDLRDVLLSPIEVC